MSPARGATNTFCRWAGIAGIGAGLLALLTTAAILWCEGRWAHPQDLSPEAAFTSGTIGTELIPLPVMQVLPSLTKHRRHFTPLGEDAGDWIEQFGFLASTDPNARGLPFGFTVSNYRPRSGAPSPVPFVGIGCATCHSTDIVPPAGKTVRIVGTGNSSVNLFAWLDAVQASILDRQDGQYVVTADKVADEYERQQLGRLTIEQRVMIGLWLDGFRKALLSNLPRFDEPFGAGRSMDVGITPTGPGRTQPFRTLVRTVLQRPGNNMFVYTKVAPVYHESWQEWAQVDGGIRGLNYRSALAVLAAGATPQNMQVPEIEHNIVEATNYVRDLSGKSWEDVFPQQHLDSAAIERGSIVYQAHCHRCHGSPGPEGTWIKGPELGAIVPQEEIGTDAERVTFRHGSELPQKLFDYFPSGHPFKFPRDDIRAPRGYLNKPIDSMFSRAPYLHNASVPTLAELINLKPRPAIFYRGRNKYHLEDVGLDCPTEYDRAHYFKFDTSQPGNSNSGHDYPWPYADAQHHQSELKDLLEYLKTL